MMSHDLRFVRMNTEDETLHCERHGLLSKAETEDVYFRVGLTHSQVVNAPRLDWLWRLREWLSQRSGPRCVPKAVQ